MRLPFILSFTFLILIIAGVFFVFVFVTRGYGAFAREVKTCNVVMTQARFSCYRSILEEFYRGQDVQAYVENYVIQNNFLSFESEGEVTYAVFGSNCHTFYHAVGDFVAVYGTDDLETILEYVSSKCTGGYVMGLYKRTALEEGYPTELLEKFYKICRKEELVQCAHEIGHNLHDKYTTAVLSTVDRISEEDYGLKFTQEYHYVTFEDREPDLNAPFKECNAIIPEDEPDLRLQCLTGIGHNMFVFSEFDPDGYISQLQQCQGVEEEHQKDCYAFLIYRIGINDAATKFLSYKFKKESRYVIK